MAAMIPSWITSSEITVNAPKEQAGLVMQELQDIVKGRGGSGSLLDQLKKPNNAVQKGIIAPLTGSPQSSAFTKAPAAAAKAGGGAHCLHILAGMIV